jgi:hypothetical protein
MRATCAADARAGSATSEPLPSRGGSRAAARRSKLSLDGGLRAARRRVGRPWVTRRGKRHAHFPLDRADRERLGACGPVVGPTSWMRAPPETVELEDGRSAPTGPSVRCRPRARRIGGALGHSPGASSKATSLFIMVTGSPPVATPVVRAALVAFCGTNTLSSLGFAALVRALRGSSPTSVHPRRHFGVGVEVTASRWSPGPAALSWSSLWVPALGEGSSELEPRRSPIRIGASVSAWR